MTEAEKHKPAAWQRYSDRAGWTAVDEGYAQYLAANGIAVRPLFAEEAFEAVIRDAFKAGWRTNATTEQPDDYLDGCEEVDWREYRNLGLAGYLESLKPEAA